MTKVALLLGRMTQDPEQNLDATGVFRVGESAYNPRGCFGKRSSTLAHRPTILKGGQGTNRARRFESVWALRSPTRGVPGGIPTATTSSTRADCPAWPLAAGLPSVPRRKFHECVAKQPDAANDRRLTRTPELRILT